LSQQKEEWFNQDKVAVVVPGVELSSSILTGMIVPSTPSCQIKAVLQLKSMELLGLTVL
jgi:hypothetical protein